MRESLKVKAGRMYCFLGLGLMMLSKGTHWLPELVSAIVFLLGVLLLLIDYIEGE